MFLDEVLIFQSLESVNAAGDSVLSIACTRGHVSVINYLAKNKGCDLHGEITVLTRTRAPFTRGS